MNTPSHDERALDATLRDRFHYLLNRASREGCDSPKLSDHIELIQPLIAYEFHQRLGRH